MKTDDHDGTIFKIMKTLHNSSSTKVTSLSMMMMRMTMIMDTMIKSLHNQCVLIHWDDIMIRDEYADDFDDMVFMMFILCTSAQSSLCLLSLQCDQVTFNCGILVAGVGVVNCPT